MHPCFSHTGRAFSRLALHRIKDYFFAMVRPGARIVVESLESRMPLPTGFRKRKWRNPARIRRPRYQASLQMSRSIQNPYRQFPGLVAGVHDSFSGNLAQHVEGVKHLADLLRDSHKYDLGSRLPGPVDEQGYQVR